MLSRKRIVTIIIILLLVLVYADMRFDSRTGAWNNLFDISFSGSNNMNWSNTGNYDHREEITGQEVHPSEALDMVNVTNSFGPVTIVGEDREDIVIDYVLEVRAKSEAALEQALTEVELNLRTRNSELQVSTSKPTQPNQVMVATTLDIRLPRKMMVDVTNRFDRLEIENIQAQAEVQIEYGQVELYNLAGPLRINASFADARLENIEGNVHSRSRYGAVDLLGLNGDLTIDSRFTEYDVQDVTGLIEGSLGYGGIRIDQVRDSLDLDTNFADVRLELPEDTTGWGLDITTSFGSINASRQFSPEDREQGAELYREAEAGQPNLKVSTEFGDVTIN